MISDESGRRLHHRATRGESLSEAEHAQLDEWLAAQDAAERKLFSGEGAEPSLAKLRSQVNAALEQVGAVARSLQQLSSENDALRQEIVALHRRLASGAAARTA